MNYEDALKELQAIVQQIQEEEIGIDNLAEKVERATVLIQFCQNKLRQAEMTINTLFDISPTASKEE